MANPTTNRQAHPVFSSSLGFGATAKAGIAFGATAGQSIELTRNIVPFVWEGLGGFGVGYPPRNKPTGFPFTPDGGSPSLKFGYGSPGLYYPGAGFVTGDGNLRTFSIIFRHDYTHAPLSAIAATIPIIRSSPRASQGGFATGFGLNCTTAGSTLVYYSANNVTGGNTLGSFNLVVGNWYIVSFSTDQTGGSGALKYKLQVYDLVAQNELTAVEITNSTFLSTLTTGCDLIIGGDPGSISSPFHGQVACVLLDKQYWTQSQFQAFYADPWATFRGTYTPSGALVAPASGNYVNGEGGAGLCFAPATGIGSGGTGSPTYFLQGYSDPAAATSTGARIGGAITPDEGGATINVFDTTLAPSSVRWYRLECVDGSSTVYFPASTVTPIPGASRAGTPVGVAFAGDSRSEGNQVVLSAQLLSRKLNRSVPWFNFSKSGLFAANWCPGTLQKVTITISGGVPTTGNWTISVNKNSTSLNSTGPLTATTTAAQIQAAILLLPNVSPGDVTVTGGPVNTGMPIVIQWNTVGNFATAVSGNGLNNGCILTTTINLNGVQPDVTTWAPFMAEIAKQVAEDSDVPWWITIEVGTNDGAGVTPTVPIDYQNRILAGALAAKAAGYNYTAIAPPLIRPTEPTAPVPLNISYNQQYGTALAALAAAGSLTFLGYGIWQGTIRQYDGSLDGEHSITGGNEDMMQKTYVAEGLALAINPPLGGSFGNAIIGGGFFP